jgi:hypothetical protein
MVKKHVTDPKILLKWSLNFFFQIFKEIIWGLFGKNTKNKKIKIAGKLVGHVCQTHT